MIISVGTIRLNMRNELPDKKSLYLYFILLLLFAYKTFDQETPSFWEWKKWITKVTQCNITVCTDIQIYHRHGSLTETIQ